MRLRSNFALPEASRPKRVLLTYAGIPTHIKPLTTCVPEWGIEPQFYDYETHVLPLYDSGITGAFRWCSYTTRILPRRTSGKCSPTFVPEWRIELPVILFTRKVPNH